MVTEAWREQVVMELRDQEYTPFEVTVLSSPTEDLTM